MRGHSHHVSEGFFNVLDMSILFMLYMRFNLVWLLMLNKTLAGCWMMLTC
jgi:hypothetical protein